jgi:phosphatidylglycerol lysyltransferase
LWHRLGSIIYQFRNSVYNLQGLRNYKEKFNPVWEPVYMATPGGLALTETLINLTNLISKGYKRSLTRSKVNPTLLLKLKPPESIQADS